MTTRRFRTTALALAALALAACATDTARSPAASAVPHGAVTVESLIDAATTYACPEVDPAQPNCRVPR